MKRKLEAEDEQQPNVRSTKRQRQGGKTQLLQLSDELLLRILSFLEINSLTKCDRISRKLRGLAKDNEIWREKYYNKFVRPRARRLPSLQALSAHEQDSSALKYSSKAARWLEHAHLVDASQADWKHNYKVKYNWTRGRARTSEVQVDAQATPGVLAQVHRGFLYTVDHDHGLRIWKGGVVRHVGALNRKSHPSSLSIQSDGEVARIAVGCADGWIKVFAFDGAAVSTPISAPSSSESFITSIALAWPYVMTMSRSRCISLYQSAADVCSESSNLLCLANLRSDADISPASLSLRKTKLTLVAGIAYAFNRFNTGWCLGLQEIRMDLNGSIKDNRTTSTVDTPIRDTLPRTKPYFTSRSASTSPFALHPQLMRAPNSLSYCGCYILAGLPDNTLMVYTVTSTDDELVINVGRRLWGHTSAVSAAEVTSTGKALSISAQSDEMRYWELEELLTSQSLKRTSTPIRSLSLLNDAINQRGDGIGLALRNIKHEDALVRRCVSFDDEQAIVVGERDQRQIVSCFDFA